MKVKSKKEKKEEEKREKKMKFHFTSFSLSPKGNNFNGHEMKSKT
jgi:hypothetical protein